MTSENRANTQSISKISENRISEMRAAFPGCLITYEIKISTNDSLGAVGFCASAFSQSRLALAAVRYSANGPFVFRLTDDGRADLRCLENLFARCVDHRIEAWTTTIGRRLS